MGKDKEGKEKKDKGEKEKKDKGDKGKKEKKDKGMFLAANFPCMYIYRYMQGTVKRRLSLRLLR